LQEIERMVILLSEIHASLAELGLGLKGDLTMSASMELLMGCIYDDRTPDKWEKKAYPSLRPLASWILDLKRRADKLHEWSGDLQLPKVTWLSGLFNPQSFLTAVMQTAARRLDWPLDRTVTMTEITKKQVDDIQAASRDGAFISGPVLEGARWDDKSGPGTLEDSRPKELYAAMPVIQLKAVTADKADVKDNYSCPVYKTTMRGPTYVFTAQLRTKAPASKWVLGGVALIMDVLV
jgi:dynein heavy chain